jgi:hypothetical protein
MCDRPATVRPLTRHHVVPQWWFRDQAARRRSLNGGEEVFWALRANVAANIVMLCRPCHDLVDHGTVEAKRPHRRMLRKLLGPETIAFAVATRGREWFDAEYLAALSSAHDEDRADTADGRAA